MASFLIVIIVEHVIQAGNRIKRMLKTLGPLETISNLVNVQLKIRFEGFIKMTFDGFKVGDLICVHLTDRRADSGGGRELGGSRGGAHRGGGGGLSRINSPRVFFKCWPAYGISG